MGRGPPGFSCSIIRTRLGLYLRWNQHSKLSESVPPPD